jgi:hypothetical protein
MEAMVTRTRSRATSLIALIAAVLLLATACSDDSGDETSSDTTVADDSTTTTAVAAEDPPSESPAASLRSDLTALLEEQVYLTGFTVQAGAAEGGDLEAPEAAATAVALVDSATELSEIVGAAYGVAQGTTFLEAWDAHQQAIIDVAFDEADAEDVDSAREAVVAGLTAADPEADFAGLDELLATSDADLITTVEQLAAGDDGAVVDLRTAAEVMPDAALELAEIIATHSATEGEVASPESDLRAELTGLMQESALLTGLAVSETVEADGDATAPGPAGVLDAVEENTVALSEAMEPEEGPARDAFVEIWRAHIDEFMAYTTALVDDDATGMASAREELVVFRDDLGELLAQGYPALTKEAVAEELVPHTDSILAYTDARVAEAAGAEPIESAQLLREAALAMRLAARSFTAGLTAPTA